MSKKAALQRRVGGPAWKPGDPTLVVSEIAEALKLIAPDTPSTLNRIRHWFREQMLLPVDQKHAGSGRHRRFGADAPFDAAVLCALTDAGIPVSGSRALVDALTFARFALPKWKAARAKGQALDLTVFIARTAQGFTQVGVLGLGEERMKDQAGFKVADVVLTIEVNLSKLWAQVAQ